MAPPEKVRVVVVHGEHLTAQALQRALGSERDLLVPAATADPGAAVVLALEVAPDVAVVDLGLAHDEAVETIRRMAEASPGTVFVALAEALAMSPATLRTRMQNIIIKLGVHSKTEALAFAIRHGRVVTGR